MRPRIRTIPFHRFAVVAASGLVAFLAFWQGVFSLMYYRPCAFQQPDYILPPNPNAAITELSLSVVALLVLFAGARRLRAGFAEHELGYYSYVVFSLLIGQGLLAFVFLRLSTCAS